MRCDVLVAGGGVAGVAAAVASARSGASTVLVERTARLGGIGGMLHQICGLYGTGEEADRATLNDGISREVAAALMRLSPASRPLKVGSVYVLPYEAGQLIEVLTGLCRAEAGRLEIRFDTEAVRAGREGASITKVVTNAGEITALAAIDCTGDGSLAALAGAGILPSAVRQPSGCIVRINGIAVSDEMLPLRVSFLVSRATVHGTLPERLRYAQFTASGSVGYLKFSIENDASAKDAARDAGLLFAAIREGLPEFGRSAIEKVMLGVRETRRIEGEYVLTEQDILSARKFDDGAVKNAWPIELWRLGRPTVLRYPPPGDYYEIPPGCMKAKGITNLFMAGRCISATHEALGSTRVMGACLSIGEQAGIAAARLR